MNLYLFQIQFFVLLSRQVIEIENKCAYKCLNYFINYTQTLINRLGS